MMSKGTIILLLSILGFMSFETFSQTSWQIDKDKDGIVVYTKVEKNSDFKSFKAVMLVHASPADIIRQLKNADSYIKWYGYTKTAKTLKQEEDVQYNYVETIFPWPYNNRDMVYRMSIDTSNPGSTEISLKGIPDYIPEKEGIVRMKKAEGYIVLKPLDDHTEVTYVFHSEPGDSVPVWLANHSIAELPFKTLSGLRKMLREGNNENK